MCGWAAGTERALAHVLVATDAALRGLDCSLPAGLALLVSYDCPTRKARLLAETVFTQKPSRHACQFWICYVLLGRSWSAVTAAPRKAPCPLTPPQPSLRPFRSASRMAVVLSFQHFWCGFERLCKSHKHRYDTVIT